MESLPHIVEDCLGLVQVYSDGSISRSTDVILSMKVQDDGSTVWKDCLYVKEHDLHLRLYKPREPSSATKLPVLLYFHGGGFCIGSRTWPKIHSCCLRLSSGLQAFVVAPDYRLAPEHRLPAAVDDALSSVEWLRRQAVLLNGGEEWFADGGVDFDRVFIMGDSSGGNMAHHVAVRLGRGSPDLGPVRVRGYILMAPFFGGTVRTKSEEEGPPEEVVNLDLLDKFWRLSVPEGNNSDHPWANPFGPVSPSLDGLKLDPILVLVGGSEVMKDRIENYTKKMKEMGKEVDYVEYKGMQHGFLLNEPFSEVAQQVLEEIRSFMLKNSY